MTSENTAPAEMPGLEEIADIIWRARFNSDCGGRAAQEVLDLFAKILAEKEREIERLKLVELKIHCVVDRAGFSEEPTEDAVAAIVACALAAEAALAGERERFRSAIKSYVQRPDDVARSDDYMIGFAAGANYTAEQIAAAIRAGE